MSTSQGEASISETQLTQLEKTANPQSAALVAASGQFLKRTCVMKVLANYGRISQNQSDVDELVATVAAEVGRHQNTKAAFTNMKIDAEDLIDAKTYPACAAGKLLWSCARTLPPTEWLQQRWELEDQIAAVTAQWYCPWCKVTAHSDRAKHVDDMTLKKAFYDKLLKETKFSVSRAGKYCEKESRKPDREVVRKCVEKAAAEELKRLDRRLEGLKGLIKINRRSEAVAEELKAALTKTWEFEEELIAISVTHPSAFKNDSSWDIANNWVFSQGKREADEAIDKKIAEQEKRITEAGLGLAGLKEDCKKQLSSSVVEDMMQRNVAEMVNAVSMQDVNTADKKKKKKWNGKPKQKCMENAGSFCPEGHGPDKQKKDTPNRAKAAFIFGMTPPGWAASWAVGCSVGFIALGPPGCVAGMAAVVALPDPLLASVYYAAFSKSWTSSCQCFQHTCSYDKVAKQCYMEPTEASKRTANPFTLLPPSGLACAISDHTNVTRGEMCELRACRREDVSPAGNAWGRTGATLKGRVGGHDQSMYNCPSVEGTVESQLTLLDEIPGRSGDKVKNTPAARNQLLELFNPVIHQKTLSDKKKKKKNSS